MCNFNTEPRARFCCLVGQVENLRAGWQPALFLPPRHQYHAMFGCGYAAPWGSFSSCGPDFIGSSRLQAGLCWNE